MIMGLLTVTLFWLACSTLLTDHTSVNLRNAPVVVVMGVYYYYSVLCGTPIAVKVCLLLTILLFITFYDAMTHRIPRFVHCILLCIGLIGVDASWLLSEALPGLLFPSLPLFFMNRFIKNPIGLGDVKLIAVGGFVVGVHHGYLVCLLAAVLALVVERKRHNFQPFAFGPYLCLFYVFAPLQQFY